MGDASKASTKLGRDHQISEEKMCAEMVASDLKLAKRQAFLASHGYDLSADEGG